MSKYESSKQSNPEKKLRAGSYKTNKLKTADFIPSVFQTDMNKKWLDSTLDQLVSKSTLEDLYGYVGDRSGRSKQYNDVYINESFHTENRQVKQLSPAIISKTKEGEIQDKITVDDIANSVAVNFDQFCYNAAYNTEAYVMNPPINVDKFINYDVYYWMPDMPIYKSYNNGVTKITGDGNTRTYSFTNNRVITNVKLNGATITDGIDFNYNSNNTEIVFVNTPTSSDEIEIYGNKISYATNIITDINNAGQPTYRFIDDDNVVDLQNGMIIEFMGGYGSSVNKNTYIVTGVGSEINMRLYNKYDNDRNIPWWVDYSTYKDIIADFWDKTDVIEWAYELNGNPDTIATAWGSQGIPRHPQSIVKEYNKRKTTSDWVSGKTYALGDYVKYNGNIYKCTTANNDVTFTPANWTSLGATVSPMLKFINGNLDKYSYLSTGMVVRLDQAWPSLSLEDAYRVFYVTVDNNGLIIMTPIIQAQLREYIIDITQATTAVVTTDSKHGLSDGDQINIRDVNGMSEVNSNVYYVKTVPGQPRKIELYTDSALTNPVDSTSYGTYTNKGYIFHAPYADEIVQYIPTATLTQEQIDIANALIGEWDTEVWDRKFLAANQKDYHVIETCDPIATIWSRGNWWIHKNTIEEMQGLINGFNPDVYFTDNRQAKRPILEFRKNIWMWDHLNDSTSKVWHGPIDFLVNDSSEIASMADGSRYILLDDPRIHSVAAGVGSPTVDVFNVGDTCLILNSPGYLAVSVYDNKTIVEKYRNHDVYWDGTSFQIGQHKKEINQQALYRLFDFRGYALEDNFYFPSSAFTGNKIFGYKVGSGIADPELGFPLTYKDVTVKADYVFENFAHTLTITYPVETSNGAQIGGNKTAEGMFSFQQNGERTHIYQPTIHPLGALDSIQHIKEKTLVKPVDMIAGNAYTIIEVGSTVFTNFGATTNTKGERFVASAPGSGSGVVVEDMVIEDVGSDNWRADTEFFVYRIGSTSKFTVSNKLANGIVATRRKNAPTLLVKTNTVCRFHDLIAQDSSGVLKFYDTDKTPYPTVVYDENNDTINETFEITTPAQSGSVLYYGYLGNNTLGKIICVDEDDFLYHTVYINGNPLSLSEYNITNNSISIPANAQVDGHNIIDIEFYNNDTTKSSIHTQVSESQKHNATNEIVQEITISETLGHWKSILRKTPCFTGAAFGFNNYHMAPQLAGSGGEIFMHNDINIMHDYNYANDGINIQESLFNQARDYWSFKRRFVNQVIRLYGIGDADSTRELTNLAIRNIIEPRKGQKLHQYSNMVYAFDDKYEIINIDTTTTSDYVTTFNPNTDTIQQDHLYVYLTELVGSTRQERILCKDIDYTINGAKITLNISATPIDTNNPAYLTVYWHDMDYDSYIPASMAKLGLSYEYTPSAVGGILTGHDGDKHEYKTSADLFDYTSENYDVVTACLYELEKRIYAGLVKSDVERTRSPLKYLPSQHHTTWYTLDIINNYTEQMYNDWVAKTNAKMDLTNYYQAGDDTTWNYKSVLIGEHFTGNTLPGHWKGAYTVLFGTYEPHLYPWHMLGMSKKPSWWDDHYPSAEQSSWGDATKLVKFKWAIKQGIISEPTSSDYIQDINYARYYWEWDNVNRFPVDSSGALISRESVLGSPSATGRREEFEYGDWGPLEIRWRESALGQSALLDAVIKLNPTRAWNDFFQPGSVKIGGDLDIIKEQYYNKHMPINPRDIIYSGKVYNQKVKEIKVRSTTTGWGNDTRVKLVSADDLQFARAKVQINASGAITNIVLSRRGVGLLEKPILDIINSGAGADPNAKIEYDIIMTSVPHRTNGINEVQLNNIHRNDLDIDLENAYYTLDTQLTHKLGGFSRQSLLNYYIESGPNGKSRINDNDYNIQMYVGKPTEIVNASDIQIKKVGNSFEVSGFSSNQQNFKYNIMVHDNNFVDVPVTSESVLRKYKYFGKVSKIKFKDKLNKVQDLYDFIRGNRKYLEDKGIQFEDNGDAVALDVIQWTVLAEDGDTYVAPLGSVISYTPKHGYVLPMGSLPYGMNNILDAYGRPLDDYQYTVDRTYEKITVSISDEDSGYEIGSVGFAEVDFEHVAIFSNITQFNDIIFDDTINARQQRLLLQGQRTRDWDGNRRAPGYLVFENKIVENWDTSVKTLDDFYNFDIENVNLAVTKSENLMLGNYGEEWYNGTNLSTGVLSKLWQGVLRDKGTKGVANRYSRGDLVYGGSDITIHEEWMFHNSHMGNTTNINATEIQIRDTDINNTSNAEITQIIDLTKLPNPKWVNNKPSDLNIFETITYGQFLEENYFRTAGEVVVGEFSRSIMDADDIDEFYNSIDDELHYPTWNGQTSYKFNDRVRYKGQLYKCRISSIGYDTQATNLTFTSTVVNPVFDYADPASDPASAIITSPITSAPVSIWFNTEDRVYDNQIATGSVLNPSIPSGSSITIDTYSETFINNPRTAVVDNTAPDSGNPSVTTPSLTDPIIIDNTGKTLIINGNTINLFNTTYPAGTALNRSDIAAIISASDPGGFLTGTDNGSAIKILYDVQGIASDRLTIGNGTANGDLGLSASTYSPALVYQNVTTPMTAQVFADKINDSAVFPSRYIASVGTSGELVITKQPQINNPSQPSDSNQQVNMSISGTSATICGLPTLTGPVTFTDIPRQSSVSEAATFINSAGISGVTATSSGNRLIISSINDSIDLGAPSNEMNDKAGIPSGVYYQTAESISNTFDLADWVLADDPLRQRFLMVNDSKIDNVDKITGTVKSKFDSWNILQVHNLGWYTSVHSIDEDGNKIYDSSNNPVYVEECSICAGTATEDGNDACINIHPLSLGGNTIIGSLEIGDYVMIVNSNSKPSVDGIHKVTALGTPNEPYKFFIDMYIQECGSSAQVFVLRNCRFDTLSDLVTATADNSRYNFIPGDKAWTNYHTGTVSSGTRGTYVYEYDGTNWNLIPDRQVTDRPINSRIDHMLLYNGQDKQTLVELEVFDPVIGLIPGVADREIGSKSPVDHAVYTHSTSLEEFTESDVVNAWAEDQIGETWWDTHNVIYYDYNQGSDDYKVDYWGRLFNNSSIDVYEWTKSTVTPDDWEKAKESGKKMFGFVPTGVPYSVYDKTLNENIYYYTEASDYNPKTNTWDPVYYFWVKDKSSKPRGSNRKLTVKNISEIITDPTKAGIPWCAAIDSDKFIVSNIGYYLDSTSVIQINKKLERDISKFPVWVKDTIYNINDYAVYNGQLWQCISGNQDLFFTPNKWNLIIGKQSNVAHDSWQLIQEDVGYINEYWYKGILDNIVGQQQSSGIRFPNEKLHRITRFGDDRKLGQGWYRDTYEARREAVSVANRLLKNMNLYTDLNSTWDRTIGSDFHVSDIGILHNSTPSWESNATRTTNYAPGDVVKFQRGVYEYTDTVASVPSADFLLDISKWTQIGLIQDMTRMWNYATYVHPDRLSYQQPSKTINRKSDLSTVDTSKHKIVQIKLRNNGIDLDEICKWDGSKWIVVEKKNATVEFNDLIWRRGGWDADPWDTVLWDSNGDLFAYYFVIALRHDLFINQFEDNFNKFFFAMVKYCISTQKQVDWVYKTTYIQLDVNSELDTTTRKYRKDGVEELIGYVNTVKPFHTKIRNVFDRQNILEEADVVVEERSILKDITININEHDDQTVSQYRLERSEPYSGTELTSTFADTTFVEEYIGADFTDTTAPTTEFTETFLNAGMYNERNTTYRADVYGDLRIMVVTNTTGITPSSDTRSFLYVQDANLNTRAYSLQNSKQDELAANYELTDTNITVIDGSKFNNAGGYAYIAGEIIQYGNVSGNTLNNITRQTFVQGYGAYETGTKIIDITNAQLTFMQNVGELGIGSNGLRESGNLLNDSGVSILNSASTNLLPQELQASTQGIDF